jgi:hypothetical protein
MGVVYWEARLPAATTPRSRTTTDCLAVSRPSGYATMRVIEVIIDVWLSEYSLVTAALTPTIGLQVVPDAHCHIRMVRQECASETMFSMLIEDRDESFNSITGLNGSGKSNILDAICFVLGITNMSTVRAQNLQVWFTGGVMMRCAAH